LLTFIFDKTLYCRTVTAYLAQQVIEQDGFPHYTCEQLLGGMWLPTYLPHYGLNRKREFALRAKLGTFLWLGVYWVNQIYSTVGTLQQPLINVRTAIAAFDFIVFGWRGEAGGHVNIQLCSTNIRTAIRSVL
jgi:hypothetical protein